MSQKMSCSNDLSHDYDRYLINEWLINLQQTKRQFQEPILDELVVDRIKLFCESLKQDSHVFATSVEILEEYVNRKNKENCCIQDQLLVTLTVIYMCTKFSGDGSEFKITTLADVYEKVTKKAISKGLFKLTEMNVLATLKFSLPTHSKIDDLKTLLVHYIAPYNFKFDFSSLCEDVMNYVIMFNKKLFNFLIHKYSQNQKAFKAFKCVYVKRLYLPSGVIICCLQLTKMKNILDINKITTDLSNLSAIHYDHLKHLASEINTVIQLSQFSSCNL